jgi:hypothetical protein
MTPRNRDALTSEDMSQKFYGKTEGMSQKLGRAYHRKTPDLTFELLPRAGISPRNRDAVTSEGMLKKSYGKRDMYVLEKQRGCVT